MESPLETELRQPSRPPGQLYQTLGDWLRWAQFAKLDGCESKLKGLLDFTSLDWKMELETLMLDVQRCNGLVEGLETAISAAIQRTDESQGKRYSIPELNMVPWERLRGYSKPPGVHAAIDVPFNEPTYADVLAPRNTIEISPATATSEATEVTWTCARIPERIRINSWRLLYLLDYGFCDGSLAWNDDSQALYVLRPFKLVFYLDKKLRGRIAELEEIRHALRSMTEEEYIEEFEKDPIPDEAPYQRGDEYKMSVSELTGYINDCRCLTNMFVDEYLGPEIARLGHGPETVRFADLWFLFTQGSLIYCKDHNIPQKIWRVVQRTGGRRYISRPPIIPEGEFRTTFTPFVLDCYYLDYDGIHYIPIYHQFHILSYEGAQPVNGLPVLPFTVAERDPGLVDRQELLHRANQFMKLSKSVNHRYYSGRSHTLTPGGQKLSDLNEEGVKNVSHYSERIDSEIIIDFSRALQEVPAWRSGGNDHEFHTMDTCERGERLAHDRDEVWDKKLTDDFLEAETRKWRQWESLETGLEDENDLLLLPDRIFAFVLRSRKWACLQLGKEQNGQERLTELTRCEEPWNNLELPQGHKEIVQSLITSHFSTEKSKSVQFDLVKDKGKGVIILLHGVPGVGKTSTAECAAESSGRPLLPITCGDLGLTPGEVEAKLQEIFRLAQAWNCILLLDEADIFLAQRTVTDMQRNALVSVFLRTLEYYEGILFLTTNRVGVFDEAFKSRIHMSLYYPPLERLQTQRIWHSHIKKAIDAGIGASEGELLAFAEQTFNMQSRPESGPVWNGRQIRNAFQTAVALAAFCTRGAEHVQLQPRYFQSVFDVSDKFSSYIWKTKQGQSDADWNKMLMTRRDDFVYVPVSLHAAAPQAQQPFLGSFQPSSFGTGMQRPMDTYGANGQQQMGTSLGMNAFPQSAQSFINTQSMGTSYLGQSSVFSSQPLQQAQTGQFQPQHFNTQAPLQTSQQQTQIPFQPNQFMQQQFHQQDSPQQQAHHSRNVGYGNVPQQQSQQGPTSTSQSFGQSNPEQISQLGQGQPLS
ncbi:hypothetical protein SLS55_010331 [Diplodia seriata]|uniref:AAA+ ATPase domain-containing protein n=1 Tax=Diplodia seriata TaxID=420778 RepID=A0ABR3BYV9_9PEZI